ncbi:MAG: ATP--guanido phosphotransferase [Lentisphaeria bacterium]|nr:ATP--guanido phosphotransferase [Lentisphaeria bacterium]
MNQEIKRLLQNPASFLVPGTGDGIAISSRIRLSRNLSCLPYPIAAGKESAARVIREAEEGCSRSKTMGRRKGLFLKMDDLDELEKLLLLERRLASNELLKSPVPSALAVSSDEKVSVMINEEDHLRLQVLTPGFELATCWKKVNTLDNELGSVMEFAWNDELGYLTECPTNVGTGMRASVMLHLPGLVMSGQIDPTIHGIRKLGLAVRGICGEGSKNTGNLYQVSNQITLGESEENIIEQLSAVIRQLIEYERRARRALLDRDRFALLDHVGRAFGLLQNSYKLSADEAIEALSALRTGVDLGLFQHLSSATVNELFLELGAGHLQMRAGLALPDPEQEVLRAKLFRSKLRERS